MTSRLPNDSGIYLITPPMADTGRLCALVGELLRQPVALLQYRYKGADQGLMRQQAEALLYLSRQAGVPLIINDDWDLARDIGADGVHLGESDADPAMVRAELTDGFLIGVSCYAELPRASRMAALDIDYLAFGAVFDSPTKPEAAKAPLSVFRDAQGLGKPTVAIGGITPNNCGAVRDAGADFIAVISGVFDAPDPAKALAAYIQSFTKVSA